MAQVNWKRNLAVLCVTQLITLVGFSAYFPIVPFYMQELGATYAEAMTLTAAFSSTAALTMVVSAPIWGALADRYGRKMMVVRATGAAALLSTLFYFAKTPQQMIIIRGFQGALCGTVGASMTLVSTQTPEDRLGFGLGTMQTMQYAGLALGPLVGGLTADTWGYRAVFPVSASLIFISFVAVIALVKENVVPTEKKRERILTKEGLTGLLSVSLVAIVLITGLIRMGTMTVSALMSLYVQSLSPGSERLGTLAGMVSSVSAISSSLAALVIGRIGDKIGQQRVLLVSCIAIGLLFIPQGLANSVAQLALLRALQGAFLGGTMPSANALMARLTPSDRRGSLFGISASVQAAGRMAGPLIGAAAAATWGMPSAFMAAAGVFGIVVVALLLLQTRPDWRNPAIPDQDDPAQSTV